MRSTIWRKTPRTDLPFAKIPSRRREGEYEHYDVTECQQHNQDILVGAKDSDFAGDTSQHRRSLTGIVVKLAGGVVLASSTSYQKTIALSSTEAEFTATALAGKSILYLRTIMEKIGLPQEQ